MAQGVEVYGLDHVFVEAGAPCFGTVLVAAITAHGNDERAGKRQTKTFGEVEDAKLFAQQKTVSLQNEGPVPIDASMRDVEILRTCESRASRFGLSVVSAFEEWFAVKTAVSGGSLTEAVRFYTAHHAAVTAKNFAQVADEFYSAKEAAGASFVYR